MGVKRGVSYYRNNMDRGCFSRGWWGEYLDL